MKNILVIRPLGGFGNRIRVVFSYYIYALEIKKELYVIWSEDNACNGFFLDYFHPIPYISFHKYSSYKPFYKGCSMNDCNLELYKQSLKLLIPLPFIYKEINEKKKLMLNCYIAFHVRRTDHVKLAINNNSFTTDEEFENFISSHKNIYVYGAFDNEVTQNDFLTKFPYIHYNKLIVASNTIRKTSLKDAIIDIFICKDARSFMGSGFSSFSDLINNLRE